MSIALLIEYFDGRKTKYTPVATQSTFAEFWLPVTKMHELKWVPLFETGVPIELDDLSEVLIELNKMRETPNLDDNFPVDGLNLLIDELNLVRMESSVKIFIG